MPQYSYAFDELAHAHRAVRALVAGGFAEQDISLVTRDAHASWSDALEGATGAIHTVRQGMVCGGVAGLLVALGGAIAREWKFLEYGPQLLASTTIGVLGGIASALLYTFMAKLRRWRLASGRRGRNTLLVVRTADTDDGTIKRLLRPIRALRRPRRCKGARS